MRFIHGERRGCIRWRQRDAGRVLPFQHYPLANCIQLDQSSFRLNYGANNRGADVTVSDLEDDTLGAMALHMIADGD